MENTEITVSMKTAMVEHQHICECYRTAATAIVEMGRSLKNIRDYKLYTALGYESFKNYLESNGDYTFKERQAYTYIKLYEDNSTKFLEEHASIGVTKLELLSKLPEYEREEFADTHDLGGMTVEEVKKLIKEKQALGEQLTFLEEERKEQTESAESLRAELEELREKLKPIEVVKRDLDEEEIDKIRLSIRQELHAEHMKELNSLKKSSREAVKAAEAEKDNVLKEAQTERDNAVKEAVAKYETALSKAKAEAEEADHAKAELEKKLKSGNADEARVALKIIFENVQKGLTEFIEKINDIEDPQTKEKFITVTSKWLRQAADDLEG